jgi:hypothetical protein
VGGVAHLVDVSDRVAKDVAGLREVRGEDVGNGDEVVA